VVFGAGLNEGLPFRDGIKVLKFLKEVWNGRGYG